MEAAHYDRLEAGAVRCRLCPNGCRLEPGATGRCRARQNRKGRLEALAYGQVTSLALDPIEKKPLYHFWPGARILSAGFWGCSLHCRFCQNHAISQTRAAAEHLAPEALAQEMLRAGSPGVAYTYNEPTVNWEYVRDAGRAVRAAGGLNVLVTNGYIEPGPLDEWLPLVDAMNIDVKSYEDAFYRDLCGGRLGPVLEAVRRAVARVHTELTLLVIPGANDAPRLNEDFSRWIAEECGPDTPLHLTAYFPRYQYTAGATPPSVLERLHEVFARRLSYVYAGNVRPGRLSETYCPKCRAVAIGRSGGQVDLSGLGPDGRCRGCGHALPVRLAAA